MIYIPEESYNNGRMTWQDASISQPMCVSSVLVFVRELNDLGFSEYIDIDCYDYKNFGGWQKYRRGQVQCWMPLPEFPNIKN